jgi:metal-sulfur cluster biosynthetic enzyme
MPTEAQIRDALRDVVDPEIGVNIVDLGLVYGVDVSGLDIVVRMTMTTRACPLHATVTAAAAAAIRRCVPGVAAVSVVLVWDPPWNQTMMSASARRLLGWDA